MNLKILSFCGFFVSLFASAESRFLSPDFKIDRLNASEISLEHFVHSQNLKSESAERPNSDCKANIRKRLCLVDPPKEGQNPLLRTCQEGGLDYAPTLEKLYDAYPASFQKVFCSLKVIFIEKEFEGTAYAGLVEDEKGKILGSQMGIRKSVLDQGLNLRTWATWKDQLNFGGNPRGYEWLATLPEIHTQNRQKDLNDFLYFVIAHEFGHIFDFANHVNQTTICDPDEKPSRCQMLPNTWGALSWKTADGVLPSSDFENRGRLCFYWCSSNYMSQALVPSVYKGLASVNFMSLYAATNPWDDFADSTAYYLMSQKLDAEYWIETKTGKNYDIIRKLYSPLMKEKLSYLKKFYSRKDLKYPVLQD